MKSLFDGSTEQLRPFIPGLVRNFTVSSSLKALLEDGAAALLPRFLGDTISEKISGASPESAEPVRKALLLAQTVVARLGFADYLPFAEVQIGDDGVTITAVENRRAAFDYQTQKLDRSLRESGWNKLDELLNLVAANKADFPDFDASPYQRGLAGSLFKSAAEFSTFYPISSRWLTFWALRPSLDAVEEDLGDSYRSRIDALPQPVTQEQKTKLLRMLRRRLAYEAVILALPTLSVELVGLNVQLNYGAQYGGSANYYAPPAKEQLDWVRTNLQNQAALFASALDNQLVSLEPSSSAETDAALGLLGFDGPFVML